MHRLKLLARRVWQQLNPMQVGPRFAPQADLLESFPWEQLLADATMTVVDCEMSGLEASDHDLLAIGAVKVHGARLLPANAFYRVIRPTGSDRLEPDNVLIHRLSDDDVQAGQPLAEALPAFIDFLGQDMMIAHCSRLDLAFLDRAMRLHAGLPLQNPVLDTAKLYRWYRRRLDPQLATEQESIALETLQQQLALPAFPRHHAYGDAMTTACLFLKLLPELDKAGHHRLKDLYRIAGA